MLRCVLLVPPGATHSYWRDRCGAYASKRGYLVVAVAATWDAAMDVILAREADVVVIGRQRDKPPDRLPRVEVVSEAPAEQPATPEQRRPIRRRAGR
jgi:hypothetical protein